MKMIDFRSDTVSWPTPQMREAMATAEVGDDVYGDDPTVNELQALAAEMTGKEAALFVTSGTQGNQVSLAAHCSRGDEAIVGFDSHIFASEAGGAGILSGISILPLQTDEIGRLDIAQVRKFIRPDDPHVPTSRLICAENSSGQNNGAPLPVDYFVQLREIADEHGLMIHLDGARLFNATTALGVDVKEIAQYVDSISICLSKGLCAPAGSIVVGSQDFIHKANRARKLFGGGMRQAGILAAAGIISLKDMTRRLDTDHKHAKMLANGLAELPYINIQPEKFNTNMVFFSLSEDAPVTKDQLKDQLKDEYKVLMGGTYGSGFRAVTHYWITEEKINIALEGMRQILA
ncbi:MAG: threonine aldolase [Cellvibrionaceae bacterium]|jgi:threonine aldolase